MLLTEMKPAVERAHAEEVAEVFRKVTPGVIGAAVSSIGLAAIVVWLGVASATTGVAFALFICICALVHILLRSAYLRDGERDARWRMWGPAFALVSLFEGVGWGCAPFVLAPHNFAAELMCLQATLGVAGGATAVYGAYRPAFFAIFIPATLPYFIQSAFSQDRLQHATTLLMMIYLAFFGIIALSANRSFQRLVAMRLQAETFARSAELANRDKSSFLAAASHDLRQPVHALGLFVGALRSMSMSPEAMAVVERLEVSTQALDSLFSALLDISKLDAGIVEVDVQAFPIAPVLDRICQDYARNAREKGLVLTLHPSGAILQSDPILIERILRNLISNAVRHTRHGRVVVGCRRRGALVALEVWDTGPGIPENQREQVFQEYVQLDGTHRDRAEGLGLGLAIVRRLAALLGCDLTLRSTLGRGSCFAIAVPRAVVALDAETTMVEPEDLLLQPTRKGLIVVVDDEPDIRVAMSTLLERWGHRVIATETVETALETLSDDPARPDLIIADFRLREGETGLQVINAIRQEYNAVIPAILITGETAPDRLREVRKSGQLVMHKPVSNSRLRAAIANILAANAA